MRLGCEAGPAGSDTMCLVLDFKKLSSVCGFGKPL